jgi:hypothetical protein
MADIFHCRFPLILLEAKEKKDGRRRRMIIGQTSQSFGTGKWEKGGKKIRV